MDLSEIDCAKVLRDLETYLDGELPPEEGSRVEAHLAACGPCLERQEFRARLKEVVRRKCSRAPLPGDLQERVREALAGDGSDL